jgi:hypothetical protein
MSVNNKKGSNIGIELIDTTSDYIHLTLIEFLDDNTPSKWQEFFKKSDLQLTLEEISDSLVMETRERGSSGLSTIEQYFSRFVYAGSYRYYRMYYRHGSLLYWSSHGIGI